MKKFLFVILLHLPFVVESQVPSIQWSKNFGGGGSDYCNDIIQSRSGNFYCIGTSISGTGQVTDHRGVLAEEDIWITKFDMMGNFIWGKSYGGLYSEEGQSIFETKDNGLVFIGTTTSNQLDVSGLHFSFGSGPFGYEDIWIVKTDSSGIIEWQRCIGSTDIDEGVKVMEDQDSNYVLLGSIDFADGDITQAYGDFDFWFAKLNSHGDILWRKTFGSFWFETPHSFTILNDGGYLITGGVGGSGGNVSCSNPDRGVWVIKLDSAGNEIWQNCYGGSSYDNAFDIVESNDGGFFIGATTMSNDGDVSGWIGYYDYWIIKCDSAGNILWEKCFGGPDYEYIRSVAASFDGGVIACGYSKGGISGSHGMDDAFVVKLDAQGNLEWQKCYGGSYNDAANSILQLADSSFVFAGSSNSWDGDININGIHGSYDYWVVKLNPPSVGINDIETTIGEIKIKEEGGMLLINLHSFKSQECYFSLTNILGQTTLREKIYINQGENEFRFPLKNCDALQILRLENQSGMISKKFFGF